MPISIFLPSRSDVRRQDTTFSLQQDNWNDFSFQTLYHLYYRRTENPEDIELIGPVKILKRGHTRVDGIQLRAPFEALGDAFCSVGVSLDYYKHLNEIDPAQRTYILDALRDVVAHPELQPQFNAEEGWTVSLFRDTDSAEFLAEARAVLLDNYTDLAELTSNLRFDGAGWADPLALDFQAPEPEWYFGGYRRIGPSRRRVLLPRRIIVLIGRNGSGKTTLLSRIARVAYASPADRARSETATIGAFDPPSIGFLKIVAVSYSAFDSFIVPGVFEGELRRLASDVQAGGGRYVFAGLRDIAAEASDVVNANETAPPADPNNPQRITSDRQQTTHLKTLDQMADEFVQLVDQIRSSNGDALFACAMEPILADPSFVDLNSISIDDLLGADPKAAFLGWSTGHKIVLHVVASLVAHIVPRTLVLYDEPETHLHPPLIAALMKAIRIVLEERNAFAIVATHSPVVIQETLARHVRVVRRVGDSFRIHAPSGETFGENAGVLTYDAFGLTASAADYQEVLDLLIAQLPDIAAVEALFTPGLSAQARAYVMAGFAAKNARR
jgi:predicted ATPase